MSFWDWVLLLVFIVACGIVALLPVLWYYQQQLPEKEREDSLYAAVTGPVRKFFFPWTPHKKARLMATAIFIATLLCMVAYGKWDWCLFLIYWVGGFAMTGTAFHHGVQVLKNQETFEVFELALLSAFGGIVSPLALYAIYDATSANHSIHHT